MNEKIRRALALILCAGILIGLIAGIVTAWADEVEKGYGYSLLTDTQRSIYDALEAAIAPGQAELTFPETQGVKLADLTAANQMLVSDCPQYFWYTGAFSYSFIEQTGAVTKVQLQYEAPAEQIPAMRDTFHAAVDKILQNLPNTSDYEKALYLHNAVADYTEYVTDTYDQTAYGALVEHKAVCAGYARAYQYLLNRAGMKAWKVDGTGTSPTGNVEQHSWVMHWLDDKCVYTDVTWNDQGDRVFHVYFAQSLEQLSTNHTPTEAMQLLLPECGHSGMNYFDIYTKEGSGVAVMDDSANADFLHRYLSAGAAVGDRVTYSCSIWYTGNDFGAWIDANVKPLVEKINPDGAYEYSYASVGHEYQLELTVQALPQTEPTQQPLPEVPVLDSSITYIIIGAAAVVLLTVVVVIVAGKKKK